MGRRLSRSKSVSLAVCLTALLALSCSSRVDFAAPTTTTEPAGSSTTSSSTTTTTTTAPPPPVWPLTGIVMADPAEGNIPVFVVKVDNSPQARPHAAINDADQIYELQVEGITRLMELFHSKSPDRVGPVRSARSSDIDLMGNLHRPLLGWSGGNPGVTGEVKNAEAAGILVDVSHSLAFDFYYRDPSGRQGGIEHTLFTSVAQLRANFTPADAEPPGMMFSFHPPGTPLPPTWAETWGISIDYGMHVITEFVWDGERGCWDRFQVDQQHSRANSAFVDEGGAQVCPENVVILFLEYGLSEVDSRSPKAISVGEGDGLAMSDGKAVAVRWHRSTAGDGWNLTDTITGEPVSLKQGRTWVSLPQKDQDVVSPMFAEVAAEILQYRA